MYTHVYVYATDHIHTYSHSNIYEIHDSLDELIFIFYAYYYSVSWPVVGHMGQESLEGRLWKETEIIRLQVSSAERLIHIRIYYALWMTLRKLY